MTRHTRGQEPPVHNATGYTNYGCRCDTCRMAFSKLNLAARAARELGRFRHGSADSYFHGCRCRQCQAWGPPS